MGTQRIELRFDLFGYHRCLYVAPGVGAHRDGRLAVATPDDAFFEAVFDFCNLRQRNPFSRLCRHIDLGQLARVEALAGFGTRQHLDQFVLLPVLGDAVSGQDGVQYGRQPLRTHADDSRLVLVDFKADFLYLLVPVEMHVLGIGIGAHDGGNFKCNFAHRRYVVADHPELHRITHRRTILKPVHPPTQHRELVFQDAVDFVIQHFARLVAPGDDHELREVWMAKLLVEWKVEARAAVGDIRDIVQDVLVALELFLQSLHLHFGGLERGALRQP